jgi:cold shock protein
LIAKRAFFLPQPSAPTFAPLEPQTLARGFFVGGRIPTLGPQGVCQALATFGTKGSQLEFTSAGIAKLAPSGRRGHIMKIGTVRWFSLQKGYGFIRPDDGSFNIFVDMSAVERSGMSDLKEGQRIHF